MVKVFIKTLSTKQWILIFFIALGELILMKKINDLTMFLLYAHTITLIYNNLYLFFASKRTILLANLKTNIIVRKGERYFYTISFTISIVSLAIYLSFLTIIILIAGVENIGDKILLTQYILYSMGVYLLQEMLFFLAVDFPVSIPLPILINLLFHYICIPLLF